MDLSPNEAAETKTTPIAFRLQFFKIIVRDLETMARFYRTTFGMEESGRIEREDFVEIMLTSPGQTFTLVLFHYTDGRTPDIGSAYGPIGFMTRDIEGAVAHAVASGAVHQRGPSDAVGMRVAFVADPEGREIELIQPIRQS